MKITLLSLLILSAISFTIPTMAEETETHDCSAISDIEGKKDIANNDDQTTTINADASQ